mmetsp:Transcript_29236/g.82297  ORF Transcript_29236/g.82297 Transcript_29236/m.82297 type:complete len:307 (+) Transcript_29236:172-1092(+)
MWGPSVAWGRSQLRRSSTSSIASSTPKSAPCGSPMPCRRPHRRWSSTSARTPPGPGSPRAAPVRGRPSSRPHSCVKAPSARSYMMLGRRNRSVVVDVRSLGSRRRTRRARRASTWPKRRPARRSGLTRRPLGCREVGSFGTCRKGATRWCIGARRGSTFSASSARSLRQSCSGAARPTRSSSSSPNSSRRTVPGTCTRWFLAVSCGARRWRERSTRSETSTRSCARWATSTRSEIGRLAGRPLSRHVRSNSLGSNPGFDRPTPTLPILQPSPLRALAVPPSSEAPPGPFPAVLRRWGRSSRFCGST